MISSDTSIEERRKAARQGGGETSIEKRHSKGLLTARERIERLCDPGSFRETDMFATPDVSKNANGDGVITGTAKINGRDICIFSQDFTVHGGSLGLCHAHKIAKIQDLAMRLRIPLIGINDSGGARIQDGVDSQAGYGEIFRRNVQMSGVVPQISVILGPSCGGAAYSPALTDFVFMVDGVSKMFLTGPQVIEVVTGEKITAEELGGADMHARKSGTAHFKSPDEYHCFAQVRSLLSYLPSHFEDMSNRKVDGWRNPDGKTVGEILPNDHKMPYDVTEIINAVADKDSVMEVHHLFARNIVCAFARFGGIVAGIVANQPYYLAGALDNDASDKASRFVSFCDAFNIPVVTLQDVPGCLPGVEGETNGGVRHGAKLLYAYSEATVPMVTVILRKGYGGAYVALGSRHLGADAVFALSTAEIAVMGPESAAAIVYKHEIESSDNPEQTKHELVAKYRTEFANPYFAAARGYIDDVITPSEIRDRIIQSLNLLCSKKVDTIHKKHGVQPA